LSNDKIELENKLVIYSIPIETDSLLKKTKAKQTKIKVVVT